VLAPHCDDGEIGCGGTIQVLLEAGHDVHYLAFSRPAEGIVEEMRAALGVLGVPPKNVEVMDLPRRRFHEFRQVILDKLIDVKLSLCPSLVFTPSRVDTHQDHAVVSAESVRAFRNVSLLGYEEPWNNPFFRTQFFVPLSRKQVLTKLRALRCYRSQLHRPIFNLETFLAIARVRGTQIERPFAEAFEVIKLVHGVFV